MERTDHITEFIENRFDRLRKVNRTITNCHVVVSEPHRRQKNGNEYQITISVSIPGKELVAKGRTNPNQGSDLYAAISDAFHALTTQIKSRSKKQVQSPLTLSEAYQLLSRRDQVPNMHTFAG